MAKEDESVRSRRRKRLAVEYESCDVSCERGLDEVELEDRCLYFRQSKSLQIPFYKSDIGKSRRESRRGSSQ